MRIWNDVVGKGEGSTGASNGVPDDVEKEWELRTVWVMGALTTAVEAGFERPTVRFYSLPSSRLDVVVVVCCYLWLH